MDKILAGRRALVVEDEMMILMMMQDMLADLGCEAVSAAATVEEALALIETHDFDVALLDMNLNGVRSYAVARALDARSVPLAFSTGNSIQDVDADYRHREFVRKPFQLKDVSKAMARLLPA